METSYEWAEQVIFSTKLMTNCVKHNQLNKRKEVVDRDVNFMWLVIKEKLVWTHQKAHKEIVLRNIDSGLLIWKGKFTFQW